MTDLYELQEERELKGALTGQQRYIKKANAQSLDESPAGQKLVFTCVEGMMAGIQQEIDKPDRYQSIAGSYLKQLEPAAVAYITARYCLFAAANNFKLVHSAMALANLISEHVLFLELEADAPGMSNHMRHKANQFTTSFHRRAILRKGAELVSVRGLEWTEMEKAKLGTKLIELFETHVKYIRLETQRENRKTAKHLRLHEKTAEWVLEAHKRSAFNHTDREPMLVPPKPWTTPRSGGYLTPEMQKDFVFRTPDALRDDMFSLDLSETYEAVNRVQATPWRVNKALYEVMAECVANNDQLADLPDHERLDPVQYDAAYRPTDIPPAREVEMKDLPEADRQRIQSFISEKKTYMEETARQQSGKIDLSTKLSTCRSLLEYEEFYFPHGVDFRGRLYPLTAGLSPQSDDRGKALIEFADGKPLGESGAFWLAVHIANLFGIDKVSFEDRVAWTQKHSDQLMDSAFEPLDGKRFWCEADSPWQALAACFEWAGYKVQGAQYVSHLPIAMDGSCSGLQHFSAMLKDPVGGAATNLVKLDKPADVYTEVQTRALKALGTEGKPEAMAWMQPDKVSRKIVKRPCMTYAYSVTSRGMRDQILDQMRKDGGNEYIAGWENYPLACYLAPLVETAIRSTVERAAAAMDWLQDVVRELTAGELPVLWYTPDGFPVVQRYMKTNGKKFKVYYKGQRFQLTLQAETSKINTRKHGSAVAPNFVHSLDAYHLRRVAMRLVDEGITTSFAMIHDSFGVHACDVDELHYAIRDEFIQLYSVDRLSEFYEQVKAMLPEDKRSELPRPPKAGSLDLEEVRDADFFFA